MSYQGPSCMKCAIANREAAPGPPPLLLRHGRDAGGVGCDAQGVLCRKRMCPIRVCAPGCGREVMQEAWETIKAMREEFQEQNNIYWAAEQEFRSWRNVDRERK